MLSSVTKDLVMTVDGEKTISSLTFNTAANHCITGETLTIKSGVINRTTAAAKSTQTVWNVIAFVTNATITVNGNSSAESRLILNGALSDNGQGFNLVGAGARVLELNGPVLMSGNFENTGLAVCLLRSSNQFTSITSSGGGTSILAPCPEATNLILDGGTVMVRTNTCIPKAAIRFQGGGLSTAGGTGGSFNRETITYTNPVYYTAGTLSGGGTESLVFPNALTLIPNSVIDNLNGRNDVYLQFKGTLSDPESGPAQLTFTSSGGATRLALFSGANTFTGGMRVNGGTVTLNGAMATGNLILGTPAMAAIVSGSCLFHFRNGDLIVCSNNATLTAGSMKFDLTGVTGRSQPVIDYRLGTLNGKTVLLTNGLTAASRALKWTLSDTGTLIVAQRPGSGAMILVR